MKVSKTSEYRSWEEMRARCYRVKHHAYSRYGGRGVTVCDRWASFDNFYEDMGPRPEGTSIDRIDNDGNYEPSNCRWATRSEQNSNRSICMPEKHEQAIIDGIANRMNFREIARSIGRPLGSVTAWAYRRGLRSGWPSSPLNCSTKHSPSQEADRG